MDVDTPTHFNAIVVGTGLSESILAAALSKAGYSILQLDQQPYYGAEWASLSLSELVTWAALPSSAATHSTPSPALVGLNNRFSLSLRPTLLQAGGEALEVLVQSKVAAYLQFGMLAGVGLWSAGEEGQARIERVPGSKADVFNHPTLSLVEKRRLTKLLLFAAGEEDLETSPMLSDASITFPAFLENSFSVPAAVASSLAYALTLCSSPEELALPALKRLRAFIRSMGRYGPSPFLVGHYGGAGDLVGGFSRVCAVWGGGQILGRPLHPLVLDPTPGVAVASQSSAADVSPPPPSSSDDTTGPLGIPVSLEPTGPPTTFTADWIISSSSHLPTLFPSAPSNLLPATAVHAIVILSSAIPFPPPADVEDPSNVPDSSLFVFPPRALSPSLGTLTALQLGSGTFTAPAEHFVLHLSAPLLVPSTDSAETLLKPYLSSLLSFTTPAQEPLFTLFHALSPAPPPPALPSNMRVVPSLEMGTEGLAMATEDAVRVAQRLFWEVVGEEGRKEGVEFFVRAEAEEGTM